MFSFACAQLDIIATFLWTNQCILLLLSPTIVLYAIYKVLRVPNRSEKRIRNFTNAIIANYKISHRGGYPENTLTAIRLSKKRGFKIVEVDVEYTKDSYPVLLHDPTVDRTSNGTGHIGDMTFAQVRELDFGIKFGFQYAGEKIPTLHEAIALCKKLDLLLLVDVKSNRFLTAKLLREICSNDPELYDHIIVVSFYPDLLYLVAREDPNLAVCLATKDWEFTWNADGSRRHDRWWRQLLAPFFDVIITFINYHVIWRLMEVPFVVLYKGDLSDERLEFWRKRGATAIVWTIEENDAQEFHRNWELPMMVDVSPSEQ